MMPRLPEPRMQRLREQHPLLADVIASDRAIEAMRCSNVIRLDAVLLRRERVRAAANVYGTQLRGHGASPA